MRVMLRLSLAFAVGFALGFSTAVGHPSEPPVPRNLEVALKSAFGANSTLFPVQQRTHVWAQTRPGLYTQVVAVVPQPSPHKVQDVSVVQVGGRIPLREIPESSNCLMLALIHYRKRSGEAAPLDIHVHMDCFSDFKVIKGQPDAVLLSLESGGQREIRWRGGKYVVRQVRQGD